MKNWMIITLICLSVIVALKTREYHILDNARHDLLAQPQSNLAQLANSKTSKPLVGLPQKKRSSPHPQERANTPEVATNNLTQAKLTELPAQYVARSQSPQNQTARDVPEQRNQFSNLPSNPPSTDSQSNASLRKQTSSRLPNMRSPMAAVQSPMDKKLAASGFIRKPFARPDATDGLPRPSVEPSLANNDLNTPEKIENAQVAPPIIPQLNRDLQANIWSVSAASRPTENDLDFDPELWAGNKTTKASGDLDNESSKIESPAESPSLVQSTKGSNSSNSTLIPQPSPLSGNVESLPDAREQESADRQPNDSQSILSLSQINDDALPKSNEFIETSTARDSSLTSVNGRQESATTEPFGGGGDFAPMNDFATENQELASPNNSFPHVTANSHRWWRDRVTMPILDLESHETIDVQKAIYLALEHSMQIQAISQQPLIAETQIDIARADFDPTLFAKSMYDDRVDPVGNTLTTGGLPFLEDNIWTGTAGLRRKTFSGANVDLQQKLGFQNSNSRFFTPQDQGTAVLSLNFEQPLLRGRGQYINRSQIMLAQTSMGVEWDDFSTKLQNELLEVVNAYWELYARRANLLQKRTVYDRGLQTLRLIEGRQELDTQAIQVAQARAAVRSRETELANAYRDVRNAEISLRRLMGYGVSAANVNVELVTVELPLDADVPWDIEQIAQIALEKRPELKRAIKQTQITAIKNQVASNQVLPDLSLLFGTYVAALDGGTGIERAWQSQFGSNPGVSAGLSFEVPYGNRAAFSRLRQSELEIVQARALVEQATIDITTDVQQSYWRLKSADETFRMASASLEAAQFELEQNIRRWDTFALTEGDWSEGQTQSLVLDQLLISQQKLFVAETITANAEKDMKQAQVFLRRAMGTLIDYVDANQFDLGQAAQAWDPSMQNAPLPPDANAPSPMPFQENIPSNQTPFPPSEPAPPAFTPSNNQSSSFSNFPADNAMAGGPTDANPPTFAGAISNAGGDFPESGPQLYETVKPTSPKNTGLNSLIPAGFRPKSPANNGAFHSNQATEPTRQPSPESPFGGFGWQEPVR